LERTIKTHLIRVFLLIYFMENFTINPFITRHSRERGNPI
jgi:hypothetical protein